MKLIKANQFQTTNWSGGTTTELFIWPEGTSYTERNFDFRLSTATVEIETSVFTPLPGISRTLMVLEGEMELQHEGHHSKSLSPFDQDEFLGDWATKSIGKCTDFNLMSRNNTKGKLQHFSMMKNSDQRIELTGEMNLIYVFHGSIECGGLNAESGDLLVFEEEEAVKVTAWGDCDFVVVGIA